MDIIALILKRVGPPILMAVLTACMPNGQDTLDNGGPPAGIGSAPTISGTPAPTVPVNASYSFLPVASDADRDTLTFSIVGLPSWAGFNQNTGELSGTPTAGDVGNYAGIQISVSDGRTSASTPQFSIDVVAIGSLSVTLSWTAPTTNLDNTPLLDLAGYKIRYGLAQGNYPNVVEINNPGLTTAMVNNLIATRYFFVASAVNSLGVESDFSNVAIVDLN